jgi:tetratricopeptide (TPR) repeat protein
VDIANLAIQISVALLTFMALVLAVAAFFGLREARQARRRNQELQVELEKTARMRSQLEERLSHLESDLQSMVFVAHLFQEGQVAYRNGDYDKAVSFYEESLRLQPGNAEIQVRLARALVNKGQNGRADLLLRAITSKDPNNSGAWRALATSRRFVDLTEALRYMEKALEIDPGSLDNWNYFGLLLRDDGRFDDALAAHQEAARIEPMDPNTLFYMSMLYTKLQRKEDAKHALYEAHTQAEMRRKTNRIRPMWADIIEWAYRRCLDSAQDEDAALKVAERLKKACTEDRNLQVILGHMIFFVYANKIDPRLDSTINLFSQKEIEKTLSRPPYKQE